MPITWLAKTNIWATGLPVLAPLIASWCIHHAGHLQHISPDNDKTVMFRTNELSHEVLQTQQPRMSITGWLKVN